MRRGGEWEKSETRNLPLPLACPKHTAWRGLTVRGVLHTSLMANVRSYEQSQVMTIRVSPQERAALEQAASVQGVSISKVIRESFRDITQSESAPKK